MTPHGGKHWAGGKADAEKRCGATHSRLSAHVSQSETLPPIRKRLRHETASSAGSNAAAAERVAIETTVTFRRACIRTRAAGVARQEKHIPVKHYIRLHYIDSETRGARWRETRADTTRGRQTNSVRGGARRKSQARPDARTCARTCETTSLLPHRARRPSRRTSSTRSSTRRSGCPCRAPTARSATARPRRPRCAATPTSRAPSSVGTKGESVVAAPLRPSGGRADHRCGTRGRGPPKRGRTSTDA